jgi:hypothetical protein
MKKTSPLNLHLQQKMRIRDLSHAANTPPTIPTSTATTVDHLIGAMPKMPQLSSTPTSNAREVLSKTKSRRHRHRRRHHHRGPYRELCDWGSTGIRKKTIISEGKKKELHSASHSPPSPPASATLATGESRSPPSSPVSVMDAFGFAVQVVWKPHSMK